MSNRALVFAKVAKTFPGKAVFRDLNLVIDQGEFFGLVGANGQGKTTLFKCLLDFCPIDDGEIHIFGQYYRLTKSRTGLFYLPDFFSPPLFVTGRDFLKFMVRMHGHDYTEDAAFKLFHLFDLERTALLRSVHLYSKGMVQKLGLIACFLCNPRLLLLDEPMNGLDPSARVSLKRHLLYLKEQGITLFFSTHLLADVEELCDRMAILHGGHLCFSGSPVACRQQYAGQNLEASFVRCISEQ